MAHHFEIFTDVASEWRWRLRADNHEPIAASSEGYVAKADALQGIEILRAMDGATTIYQEEKGEWRWRLTHANGRIIATAGESYVARSDCEDGLALTTKLARQAPLQEMPKTA